VKRLEIINSAPPSAVQASEGITKTRNVEISGHTVILERGRPEFDAINYVASPFKYGDINELKFMRRPSSSAASCGFPARMWKSGRGN
jgi:hypothetical protein